MTTLYHVANPRNRENIKNIGLVPKIGDSYACHHNFNHMLPPLIFLSLDNKYDSTWDDDRYLVEIPDEFLSTLNIKPDFGGDIVRWVTVDNIIPPEYLTLIYCGTGE